MKKLKFFFVICVLLTTPYTLHPTPFVTSPDTVNEWYYVGASGPIDTTYSRIVSDTATEGTKSQSFMWNSDIGIHVKWEKRLSVIYKTPRSFYINYYLNKLEPLNGTEGAEFQIFFANEDTLHPLSSAALGDNEMHFWHETYKQSDRYPNPPKYFNRIQIDVNSSTLNSEWLFDNLYLIYDKKEPIDSVIVIDRFGDPMENAPPEVKNPIADVLYDEDTGEYFIADLTSVFYEPNSEQMTFSFTSSEPKLNVALNGSQLSLNPAENFFGMGTVIVSASDDSFTVSDIFNVTITPVDDEPGAFNLATPANNATVDSFVVLFSWTESADFDDDGINYTLFILGVDTINLTNTNFVFNGKNGVLKPENMYAWFVVASDGISARQSSVFIFKTPKTTGIWDKNKIPLSFALEQNYPNPFNPTTTIRYSLPEKSFVRLEIYNIAGQKIATLVDGEKNAGYYETKFDANNFASGIYFYVLRAGKFTERKKMVLMK